MVYYLISGYLTLRELIVSITISGLRAAVTEVTLSPPPCTCILLVHLCILWADGLSEHHGNATSQVTFDLPVPQLRSGQGPPTRFSGPVIALAQTSDGGAWSMRDGC